MKSRVLSLLIPEIMTPLNYLSETAESRKNRLFLTRQEWREAELLLPEARVENNIGSVRSTAFRRKLVAFAKNRLP